MLRLSASYEGKFWHFRLPAEAATLGSSSRNKLVLPVPGVSREHVRVERTECGVRLVNLGSKNGIVVEGRKVDQLDLLEGSTARLGRATLRLENVASSELDVALLLAKAEPIAHSIDEKSTSTAGDATTADVSPSIAMRLVRQIEQRNLDPRDAGFPELLDSARRLMEARWLAAISQGHDHDPEQGGESTAILLHAGELPAQDEIAEARVALESSDRGLVARSTMLVRRIDGSDEDLFLAAMRTRSADRPRPWQLDLFEFLARRLATAQSATPEIRQRLPRLERELVLPPGFVAGPSAAMESLLASVRATVHSRLDVLLVGETGTGKELLARLIHDSGPTARGPYIAINCAAIPSELLEAELFGVEGRVATGVDPRPGLFVRAEGGTIFLDEIGDMSEPMQAKLLRTLQEREVLPIGAHRPKRIDVRVISASNKPLGELVAARKFRSDLFYRLRGLQFHLPPLRERKDDIPALVTHFAAIASDLYEKWLRGVSRRALELLLRHEWPGNVRELRSEVERAVLLAEPYSCLEERHFASIRWLVEHPQSNRSLPLNGMPAASTLDSSAPSPPAHSSVPSTTDLTLETQVGELERQLIRRAMAQTRNNKSRAARLLGITRNGLALKLKRLGLDL